MTAQLDTIDCAAIIEQLAEAGRDFYRRGWVLGTSGNFSARLPGQDFRILITRTGANKGSLSAEDFLVVDRAGQVTGGTGRPSAETALHLTILQATGAGSVFHTHSVCATILSQRHAPGRGIEISGYEMLKGLAGVGTHLCREWLPILDNSQDYAELSREVDSTLLKYPESHGFLLNAHGLYTWGADVAEGRRHIEILEFLMEVITQWQS